MPSGHRSSPSFSSRDVFSSIALPPLQPRMERSVSPCFSQTRHRRLAVPWPMQPLGKSRILSAPAALSCWVRKTHRALRGRLDRHFERRPRRLARAFAEAADTTPDRVAVHALHQHDGPRCDFGAEALLEPLGLGGKRQDSAFLRETISRTADSLKTSLASARPVTHLGVGRARLKRSPRTAVSSVPMAASRSPARVLTASPSHSSRVWLRPHAARATS